jgi:hypothetical protein
LKKPTFNRIRNIAICVLLSLFGYLVNQYQSGANTKIIAAEIRAIQIAADNLQRDCPMSLNLAMNSNSADNNRALTAALLGHNGTINRSNQVFILFDSSRVKNGLLMTPIANVYYGFRVISYYSMDGGVTNRLSVFPDFL